MEYSEVLKIVRESYLKHKNLSYVGVELRDQHSVGSVKLLYGKSLLKILKESLVQVGINFPYILDDQLRAGIREYLELKDHISHNSRDKHNKRILSLKLNKLFRLIHYYDSQDPYFKKIKKTETTLELVLNKYLAL